MEGNLGNVSMLPQCLTLFLVEGMAEEWNNTPGPFTSMPESSPQLPSEGSQCHPTHTEGTLPKVPPWLSTGHSQSQPQSKLEKPDPNNHPHRWIHVEMEKTIPQLVEGAKTQWEGIDGHPPDKGWPPWLWGPSMCPVAGGSVQAAPGPKWGFGWWYAPPGFSRLCPTDFLVHTDTSSPRDFQVMRQEKTLALARLLQACTEELGSQQALSAGVHKKCKSVWTLDDP